MLHRQLSPRARSETGDTLVELLIAIVIIALSVSALLGALITSITSSGEHRSLANLDTVIKGFAETSKYQIEANVRTDPATVTSGSDSVVDSSATSADSGRVVTGPGIPPATYVGTVTPGSGFLLSSSATTQVNVNATDNGTSVTIIEALFADCASVSGTAYNGTPVSYNLPTGYTGYTVGFTSVQYWDSATDQFDPTCGPNDHTGYQLLTVTAIAPSGVSEAFSFGVRSPT